MLSNIFINTILNEKINIAPKYINKNIEQNIYNIITEKFGDKCLHIGYIYKDSIKILKRSDLKISSKYNNGSCDVSVSFECKICYPEYLNEIECKIEKIEKMGPICIYGPIYINIPIELHNDKKLFNNLKKGDTIVIVVLEKKIDIIKNHIRVIGKLKEDDNDNSIDSYSLSDSYNSDSNDSENIISDDVINSDLSESDENLDDASDENLDDESNINLDDESDINIDDESDINLDDESDINIDDESDINIDDESDINIDDESNINLDDESDVNVDEE